MSDKTIARVELWIWILLYGGLLALVFGLAVERRDFPLGWSIVVGGGIAAATGIFLIFLRSRMKTDNRQRT
ncbi:hypothetical protein HLB44_17090 [Aquincola sp. S2]|uniref:Uncharacterized protein n=1 Tax=Pseudaquabacterium terrae TaxID=2732868 RepID=A0ABX2EJI2_9BURK|nr:hypothetical protein [Aquabacterium terrae]NRF68709.1 hypothetical protein [Aquabacterium terrae]